MHKPVQLSPSHLSVRAQSGTTTSAPRKHHFVTDKAGKQLAHALPAFEHPESKKTWYCQASGFLQRTDTNGVVTSGVALHVNTINLLFADVPAEHSLHAGCITSLSRKYSN